MQERLAALVEERKRVIEDDDKGAGKDRSKGAKGGGIKVDAEDMVAKEAQRLEVMKRRQERELNQMVAYELLRKQMQVSIHTCDRFLAIMQWCETHGSTSAFACTDEYTE